MDSGSSLFRRNGAAIAIVIWTVIVFVVAQQFAMTGRGANGGAPAVGTGVALSVSNEAATSAAAVTTAAAQTKQCQNQVSELAASVRDLSTSSAKMASAVADAQSLLKTCQNQKPAASDAAPPRKLSLLPAEIGKFRSNLVHSGAREHNAAAPTQSFANDGLLPAEGGAATGDRSTPVFLKGQRGYCSTDAECVNGGRCDKKTHGCICALKNGFAGPYCQEEIPAVTLQEFRSKADPYMLPGIALRTFEQQQFFKAQCGSIRPILDSLPRKASSIPADSVYKYYYDNEYFTDCDAAFYMCMINFYKPKRIIEVGCGFSTTIASYTIKQLGLDTELTAIDPEPRIKVKELDIQTIVAKVQDVPMSRFLELQSNDILFIDSSHKMEIGSDVHLLFNDVLPRLAPGVVVHVHDVYFPHECGTRYTYHPDRWNEWQYLETFLSYNKGYEILASTTYFDCNPKARAVLDSTIGRTCSTHGANLWMRRTAYHH